jgi:riboflavin kinase/FMN adenylyltransferase
MPMQIHRHLAGAALRAGGCVATIGAFDGLHRGHQHLIGSVVAEAKAAALPSVVVTFDPPPRALFQPASTLQLMSLHDRLAGLAQLGVDHVLLLRFDHALAAQRAPDFAAALRQRLGGGRLRVGPGFHFGRGRQGDLQTMAEAGLDALEVDPLLDAGLPISSSRVRAALIGGHFDQAHALLGRPYRYSGRVCRGKQLGRQLGFPTANLRWPSQTMAFSGIFAVWVHSDRLDHHPAVASLGVRPAVGGGEPLLEVHLFDFDDDLYGQRLCVEFVAKQRDEWHFDGLDALKAQIAKDASEARHHLDMARSHR